MVKHLSKSPVTLLIAVVAIGAASAIAATLPATVGVIRDRPAELAGVIALTLALQLLTLRHPGKGAIGFASLGLVLAAIALGAGPAMVVGALVALVQWIRTRGLVHRAVFDAGNLALASGAAGLAYEVVTSTVGAGIAQFLAATAAGGVYVAINHALLCLAMGLSESRSPRAVWRERLYWARYYLLASCPLAGLLTVGDNQLRAGVIVSLALSLVLLLRMRRDLRHAHAATPGRPA
jgi:hypothetical protein